MPKLPLTVYTVDTPNGSKDSLSCLPHEQAFRRGLSPEAVIGELRRPLKPNEAITPAAFARNRVFVDFMHEVIARRGPEFSGLIAEARRQGDGWVYIIDQRTKAPQGAVPREDIVGAFEVKEGQLLPGSYRPNPKHMLAPSPHWLT